MVKYKFIANEIRRLIRKRQLKPGDPMPSDRELAELLRVSPHTLRYASDLLCREGLLDRRHGSGTFIKGSPNERRGLQKHHRIGLLYVDMEKPLHPYSQSLTFGLQAAAFSEGYELLVEEMRSDDLMRGKLPEMIRRRSVDAVILDGRIRDFHIHFLQDQQMLYLVTGNCPLSDDVPQVRWNMEGFAFEITRTLLQAGRHPVWFDVDPAVGEMFHVAREKFRGYAEAVKQFNSKSTSLHLCPLLPDRIAAVAETLFREGLEGAAVVVVNWSAAMLPAALAMHSPRPHDLLIVPMPNRSLSQSLHAPNVVEWSKFVEVEETAQQAVTALVPLLEGKSERLNSVSLEMSCKLVSEQPRPRMELIANWQPKDTFAVHRIGQGGGWRHLGREAGDGSFSSVIESETDKAATTSSGK